MKKIDLGQTISVLANVGVIAGIVFLAFEIREVTRATQAESTQTATAMEQEFLLHIASDASMSQLWRKYIDAPETLSAEEKIQGGFLFSALFRRLENIYLQHRLGALSDESWEARQDLFVRMANSKGYSTFLEVTISSSSNKAFIKYMNQLKSSDQ